MIKSYSAKYVKKSGEERSMNFVRVSDLPESFLNDRIKGDRKTPSLATGMEVVWDLDNNGFRVFNWNTVIGEAVERETEINLDA